MSEDAPKQIWFVTSNQGKFREVQKLGRAVGLDVLQVKLDLPEIRGTLEEIAEDKVRKAQVATGRPVIVDDSGLFVKALRTFPGQFSAFILQTIGNEGLLKLMQGVTDRRAEFRCCAVYYDGVRLEQVTARCEGTILDAPRGRGTDGFGFDPIFVPTGHLKTFAEDVATKQKISHRTLAYRQLFARLAGPGS
ncbi:MAG TPA: RdgB/HAM1 family non-canonical purine NTP pyrophosphatase [archaeon]|nr:RdgB/HAM1 family non-canonical purine NTP pyrophosphatase [archaeon]